MARLIYSGDINIEHGGMFYSLQTWHWDYVNAVRVIPCSDASGPDNCYWVERLTVNIRGAGNPDRQRALDCIGINADEFKKLKRAARRHVLIDAHVGYGFYDVEKSELVQVGAKMDRYYIGHGEFKPETILRGNASLERFARAAAHAHCD